MSVSPLRVRIDILILKIAAKYPSSSVTAAVDPLAQEIDSRVDLLVILPWFADALREFRASKATPSSDSVAPNGPPPIEEVTLQGIGGLGTGEVIP